MEELSTDVFTQICAYLPADAAETFNYVSKESSSNLQLVYDSLSFWKIKLERLLGVKLLLNGVRTNWKTRYEVFAALPSPNMIYKVQSHYEPIDMTIAAIAGIVLNDKYRENNWRVTPDKMTLKTLRFAVVDNNIKVVARLLRRNIFEPIHIYDAVVFASNLGYTKIADLLMKDDRYKQALSDPNKGLWDYYYKSQSKFV
jgi:hypothetical protein